MRLASALLAAAALTWFAYLLVRGDGPGSGDVVLGFSKEHGINAGDLPVIAVWLLGLASIGVLYRRR